MLNNSIRRRFDRCLVQGCTVQTVNLVGTEAIPNYSWDKYNPWKESYKSTPLAPSDHFGLDVSLKIEADPNDTIETKTKSSFWDWFW
jgi:hypothetical protein